MDRTRTREVAELADQRALERFVRSLVGVRDAAVTLRTGDGEERVAYDEIDRARTVFTWAPAEKPGKGRRPAAAGGGTSTTSDEDKDGRR